MLPMTNNDRVIAGDANLRTAERAKQIFTAASVRVVSPQPAANHAKAVVGTVGRAGKHAVIKRGGNMLRVRRPPARKGRRRFDSVRAAFRCAPDQRQT